MALLLSFAGAPFSHVHAEDLDHSSVSGSIHQHVQGHQHEHEEAASTSHPDVEVAARTADDDAVDVTWTVAPPEGFPLILAGGISGTLRIPLPPVSSRLSSDTRIHVDDWPDVLPRQTRAPPSV